MTRPIEALALLALIALAACTPPAQAAPAAAAAPPRRALTVNGTATLDLLPDCLPAKGSLASVRRCSLPLPLLGFRPAASCVVKSQ